MYKYRYKDLDTNWNDIKHHEDFEKVSFPKEENLTDELLAKFNITRYKVAPQSLEVIKQCKKNEMKKIRDEKEIEDIEYNGHMFDYDNNAQKRINIAYQVLQSGNIDKIIWTTADNQNIEMSANDFIMLLTLVAMRSNTLHVKYRTLSEQIDTCESAEAVINITWSDTDE